MAIPKLNVNKKPDVPTRTPRGNASTSVGATRGKVGTRPVPAIPAKRAAPPPQTDVPTKAPRGRGGTSMSGVPVAAPTPKKIPPGPYGQPVISRGTIGISSTSVKPAPPQKKGSSGVVGGGTAGRPVRGPVSPPRRMNPQGPRPAAGLRPGARGRIGGR